MREWSPAQNKKDHKKLSKAEPTHKLLQTTTGALMYSVATLLGRIRVLTPIQKKILMMIVMTIPSEKSTFST